MTARLTPLKLGKRQAGLSSLELDSANSCKQVLIVLRSGKETSVVWTYSKKVVDGIVKSTEAAEEPTKFLTVSMPLDYSSGPLLNVVFLLRNLSRTSILTY